MVEVRVAVALRHDLQHVRICTATILLSGGNLVGIVNVVANGIGEVGCEVEVLIGRIETETSAAGRVGVADDSAVVEVNNTVIVKVLEFQCTRTYAYGTAEERGRCNTVFLLVGLTSRVV